MMVSTLLFLFWPIAEAHRARISANRKFIIEIRHNEEGGRVGGRERTLAGRVRSV
jgi:hypothetical protein